MTPPTSTTPPPTPTPTEPTSTEPPVPTTPAPPAIPESYTFTAPEGKTLDAESIAAFTPIAKELGLTQAAAQRLVDFYNTRSEEQSKLISASIAAMGEKWMAEAKANPRIGPYLETEIRPAIGRMFDTVFANAPETRANFQKAMNDTMAGNNPAYIEAFWAIAKRINESSRYVTGAGPAETGQNPNGTVSRPSLAEAMYGHLRPS